jgi:nucleoside phosphorylase
MTTTTLFVAAYAPELERLAAQGAATAAIGIGAVESAAGAERILLEQRPARVILVGTAGSYPGSTLAVGQVAVARVAHLALRSGEYAPAPMGRRAEADRDMSERLATLLEAPLVEVASPLGITSSDEEAARLAKAMPVGLEQLECFSLFRAAARVGIPATALFAVANRVGASAQAEWRQNRVVAEEAAQTAALRLIRG